MHDRVEKLEEEIKRATAMFFEIEGDSSSLLTFTKCELSSDAKYATIYMTVLPEKKESAALMFAMKKRSELTAYIRKNSRVARIPFIDIKIDEGEKNRQRVDDLLTQG